jgi:hypothetical protein
VAVVSAILRFLAYLYHGLLALLMLALGTVLTLANAGNSVRLDMLPWSGSNAVWALLIGGILGLLLVILAIRGILRPLFFLWALVIVILMIKGYFLSGYRFTPAEFDRVAYMLIGAIIALIGAFSQMFNRSPKR